MTEDEAKTRLSRMVSATLDPVLDDDDLSQLLTDNLTFDSYGRGTNDSGYVDTWNLNNAAADGWAMKAGKVAARNQGLSDGRGQATSYLYLNCVRLEKVYRDKAKGQVSTLRLRSCWF
jgi:hypothetical protein